MFDNLKEYCVVNTLDGTIRYGSEKDGGLKTKKQCEKWLENTRGQGILSESQIFHFNRFQATRNAAKLFNYNKVGVFFTCSMVSSLLILLSSYCFYMQIEFMSLGLFMLSLIWFISSLFLIDVPELRYFNLPVALKVLREYNKDKKAAYKIPDSKIILSELNRPPNVPKYIKDIMDKYSLTYEEAEDYAEMLNN
ncbi:MAG: hypothetical protein HUJ68_01325 [Clostridia bacterium]|nr:hypothetical protein [Clostridia bacterium]